MRPAVVNDFAKGALVQQGQVVLATLFGDGGVGQVIAGAVEEHADSQGDALARLLLRLIDQLLFFVFLFQAQRREVTRLFLPGPGYRFR